MDMTIAQQLQYVFNNDYQGYENFAKNVIDALFGEGTFVSYEEDFLDSSDKKKKASQANIIALKKVGEVDHFHQPLEVFDITLDDHSKIAYSRVGIQHFLRSNEGMFNQQHAFLLFHYKDTKDKEWRFSYLYKADKKKDSTSAKRFTYLMGKEHSSRTAVERFSKLLGSTDDDALMEAFSVETLSKDFFNTYKKHYLKFCEFLYKNRTDNNLFDKYFSDRDDKEVRDYVKKMLGRIVFLCFLQRKGWLCGQQDFLQKVFTESKHQEHFLDVELEALFFAFLNTEPANRESVFEKHNQEVEADIRWDKSLLKEWKEIPYLNGGLFEPDQIDFPKCTFPKEYFQELLDFFAQYNFTIDENDPNDAEVGVDPEMLGKIFENLLEDNKDKGAFYTPKEIVQYMCKESLIAYLTEGVQDTAQQEEIRQFITTHQLPAWDQESCSSMEKKLQDVKICDPAIGSGAFPMGLLNELVALRETIDFARGGNITNRAELKRQIIQENIYGVDIENGAIDIARLRFWLSIVVDSEKPEPLPNFDYKFVQGNSLISTYEGQYIDLNKAQPHSAKELMTKKKELAHLQKNFYNLTGEEKHAKEIEAKLKLIDILELQLGMELQKAKDNSSQQLSLFDDTPAPESHKKPVVTDKEVQKLIDSLELMRKAYTDGSKSLAVKSSLRLNFFDWNITFSEVFEKNGGFNIVIGNPPYISHDNIPDNIPCKNFICYEPFADLYCYFYEIGVNILASNGLLMYITSNSFLRSNYGFPLRKFILNGCDILALVDIEGTQVFGSAVVNTVITCLRKGKNNNKAIIVNAKWLDGGITEFVNSNKFLYKQNDFEVQPWTLINPKRLHLRIKIEKAGSTLENLNTKIRLGLATGDNNAFIIDEKKRQHLITLDSKNAEIIKPVIRGQDIKRYSHSSQQFLLLTKNGIDVPNDYPTLYKYLDSFGEKFKNRGAKGRHWTNLRACAFFDDFKKEKIIWIELTDTGRFSLSVKEEYLLNSAYFLLPPENLKSKYLLGILNSSIIKFYIKQIAATSGMGTLRWINNYIKQIPIPSSTESQQISIISIVDKILAAKKADAEADTSAWETEIDQLVYELYGLTEEEIKIVEG